MENKLKELFMQGFNDELYSKKPVDWFNTEEWDMDYQWISRIAIDPKTKKFVGEGIRIGIFQLDKTGKKLDKWIFREDFYMYPSCDSLK